MSPLRFRHEERLVQYVAIKDSIFQELISTIYDFNQLLG